MIRKKLPSAIVSVAHASFGALTSAQFASMCLHEIANCARRRHFLVRQARLHQSETMSFVSRGVPLRALATRCARQVLPRGRQKTPSKYLKNKEKYSPGFALRVVQRIESRSASGYGIGVGEWG